MSGLLQRYSSYSSPSASHHIRPSPSTGSESPPSDPFPPFPNALKPSDVLINRSHQLKRFAKHLALYFQALSQSHHAHALSLQKLSQTIPLPIQEASIFLPCFPPSPSPPLPTSDPDSSKDDSTLSSLPPVLGGTGQEGWAQILQEIKSTNERVLKTHLDLSKSIIKQVVGPLTTLREMMKGHINAMEKDINRLCDLVQKERDLTAPLLSKLESVLSSSSVSTLRPQFSDDPLLIRAQLELQLSNQLQKENDLLNSVKNWTLKTFQKEKEIFSGLSKIYRDFESMNSDMLLGNQQLSMFLSATVDSVPPESEWNYFLKLNHTIPTDLPFKTLKDLEWKGKGDEKCKILLQGNNLERQTSFLKSWKPCYFILTATGHLLLYQPPPPPTPTPTPPVTTPSSSSSNLTVPPPVHHSISNSTTTSTTQTQTESISTTDSTSLSTISPTAFQLLTNSTPIVSLYLPNCSLGPMPTPEFHPVSPPPTTSSTETVTTTTPQKKKKSGGGGGGLDAAFTLIENEGKGTKHILRAKPISPKDLAEASIENENDDGEEQGEGQGEETTVKTSSSSAAADEWETMGIWIKEISKFTLPAPPSPSLPSIPISSLSTSTNGPPPALPSRSTTTTTTTTANSPPLPNLPTPASSSIFGGFFSSSSTSSSGVNRSSVTSSNSTTTTTVPTSLNTEEEDEEGFNEEVDLGSTNLPPPLPPRDRDRDNRERTFSNNSNNSRLQTSTTTGIGIGIEGENDSTSNDIIIEDELNNHSSEEEDEEDRGDLGRSLSSSPPSPPPPRAPPKQPPTLPIRTNSSGGRVANLAKAFDQEASKNSSPSTIPTATTSLSPKLEETESAGGDKVVEEEEEEEEEQQQQREEEEEVTKNENNVSSVVVGKNNKKNKKKNKKNSRKSKGDDDQEETEKQQPPQLSTPHRSFPLATESSSSSPKSSDLSLASPPLDLGDSRIEDNDEGEGGEGQDRLNPFELNLKHFNENETVGDLSGAGGEGELGGDLSFDEAKLEREYGEGLNGGEEDVASPPPMVLQEVEEGPTNEEGEGGEDTQEKHEGEKE
ncbi:hypothetical protein JCM3765_000870 [Sporobolomyces pararoseus]